MTTTLTMHTLIRHFEDRLRQIDRRNLGDATGKEPQYPQLVIYLGKDAAEAHKTVSASLLQTWPQYEHELKFLCVEKGAALTYGELSCEDGAYIPLTEEGVSEIASAMFGTKMHFADRSKLLVYYVLDTTAMRDLEDFLSWLPAIRQVKQLLSSNSTDLLDMLFLLLNENLARQKTAARIRDYLSGFYSKNAVHETVSNVLLLSNRRSDNAILEDWEMGYKILSAAIILSNNDDVQVTGNIFCNGVLTASYAREEKPIAQIGQVVVRHLLNALSENITQTDPKLLEDSKLAEKLGLTKNGTFRMLDQYAETSLFSLLPTPDQLELFPRVDTANQSPMAGMSANAFNAYTMGAWEQFLAQIARSAQEKVALNTAVRQSWSQEYRKLLVNTFSKEEILYLADHIDDVAALLSKTRLPSYDTTVLEAAKEQLKYMLSSDEKLIRVFLGALQQQGAAAADFTQAWNNLLKSRRQIFDVRDANMAAFYERKVRNFFDRRGSAICEEFAAIHSTEELVAFLENLVDDVIDSDEIFSAAFEDELETRLNEDALPTDAKQYIRKKLTGSGVFTYLQTDFDLGEPVESAILLKLGTPLHKNLNVNLPPTTTYYNTGSGSAAEALVIYRVSENNLVNGGGK